MDIFISLESTTQNLSLLLMIKIAKSNQEELNKYHKKEWEEADKEHYGQKVSWRAKMYYLKAVEEGNLVGSLRMRIKAGVAHIEKLIVSKTNRRRGIGKKLMQQAEEIAKKNSTHKIDLITGKGWEAEDFYKSLGYQISAKLPKHSFKIDFVAFTKFI